MEVALVLVALIYNEVDKPEPISPLLLAHFANMDDCVGAAKLAQVQLARFLRQHFNRLSLCACRSNRRSRNLLAGRIAELYVAEAGPRACG